MTMTEQLAQAQDRFQKIQLQAARVEESLRQKKGEADRKIDKVQTIVGNKDLVAAEGTAKALYEELSRDFEELNSMLDELEKIVGAEDVNGQFDELQI